MIIPRPNYVSFNLCPHTSPVWYNRSLLSEARQREAHPLSPRAQTALFATMQEKEPLVAAHFQTRKLAVLACDWDVRSKSHADAAEDIKQELKAAGILSAIHHILESVIVGYSAVAVDWLPGGQKVRGFVPIMPDAFIFDEGGFPALVGVDGLETPSPATTPRRCCTRRRKARRDSRVARD